MYIYIYINILFIINLFLIYLFINLFIYLFINIFNNFLIPDLSFLFFLKKKLEKTKETDKKEAKI